MKTLHIIAFIVLSITWSLCCVANANDVKSIRAYEDNDKTRIVFDMNSIPRYSSTLSKNGMELELRIFDIDDPNKKYGVARISTGSSISKVSRGRRTNEIVYVFYFKKPIIPNVFSIKSDNSQGARLVLDFPSVANNQGNQQSQSNQHNQVNQQPIKPTNTAPNNTNERRTDSPANTPNNTSNTNHSSTNNGKENVKEVSDIASLEAELFEALNSSGNESSEPVESVEQRLQRPEPPKPSNLVQKKFDSCTVVIDPGHGGKDPGAIGHKGLKEKDVTLDISKNILLYINGDSKINGYLTRTSDKFIELGQRSEIARQKKADILISIHADSATNSSANGASVLVLAPNRAKRENDKLEKDKEKQMDLLGGAGEMIATISQNNPEINVADWIIEMSSDTSISYGRELAREILTSLRSLTRLHNKNPIDRSLAVLKAPDIPSLLIETGFVSNYDEEKLLSTPKYRREVAYAIYLGIRNFINKNETICMHKSSKYAGSAGSEIVHVVVRGDSLGKIAQKYGVSVSELKKYNNLKSNNIRLGQKLRIPSK